MLKLISNENYKIDFVVKKKKIESLNYSKFYTNKT